MVDSNRFNLQKILEGLAKCFATIYALTCLSVAAMAEQPGKLRIVTESWPPYSYEDETGIKGISTEIVLKVVERAGVDYSIHVFPWSRAYSRALHDKNTLIFAMLYSPDRAKQFQMIGQVAPTDRLYIYKLATRSDILVHSLEDARKYVAAASRGSVMESYLTRNGFPNKQIVMGTADAFKLLEWERVDLVLSSAANARALLVQEGKPIDFYQPVLLAEVTRPFMALGPKADSGLAARLLKAYQELIEAGEIPDFAVE